MNSLWENPVFRRLSLVFVFCFLVFFGSELLAQTGEIRPGVLRTPEERFDALEDYPFAPHYVEVMVRRGTEEIEPVPMRMHYVDEGRGETVLMLHGQPTWSYLYRKMIPIVAAHHRVIAPDWIGFGMSDKFRSEADYSFRMHFDAAIAFVEALDLHDVTLVMQDWGGFLGLPLAARLPDRIARLVVMNTALPTGYGMMTANWYAYRDRSRLQATSGEFREFSAGNGGRNNPENVRAYSAPFPDPAYYAGPNTFPQIVPMRPGDPASPVMLRTADILAHWDKPALVLFSDGDAVLGPHEEFLRRLIPTSSNEPRIVVEGAGHFLQEDKGEEVARHIVDFMARHPM
ncbi:MAG: alpha/beta fold hydrolase [Pseudomonadales bacterium]|nr:alpha/beta fold hydrolase [Pseudomonadales bacterium]MCP5358987.1 alpha/beta fold hydrolase [Pseudomonadales bacterium]